MQFYLSHICLLISSIMSAIPLVLLLQNCKATIVPKGVDNEYNIQKQGSGMHVRLAHLLTQLLAQHNTDAIA